MAELKIQPKTDFQFYKEQLDSALAREKEWRKRAKEVVAIYEAEEGNKTPFNILFSNTELLAPALYGRTPVPTVGRRFKDEDPVGKIVSKVAQRTLSYLVDDNNPNYTPFDDLMKKATLEGLVAGRGNVRVKYDSDSDDVDEYETICGVEVPWNCFLHGYAKKWSDVPWIAFEHFMTFAEIVDLLQDESLAKKVPLTAADAAISSETEGKLSDGDDLTLGHIYEIWDKEKKQIVYLCPDYPDLLKTVDDTWNLTGFFPIPKPIGFYDKISGLTPQCLYEAYRTQAEELNRITVRINKIMNALKVRGFYDGSVQKLADLMQADDNTLIAADNVQLLEGKGLDKLIWFAPLGELVAVLQQLYLNRTQIKSTIFEITGLSDLMRGDTAASETASAQGMKNQWGSMRLKKMQREVMRYARDLLRLMAELSLRNFSIKTLQGMTGLQIPTNAEKQQAQQISQALTMQIQQGQQQGLPPDQKAQEALGPLQAVLQQPSWEDLKTVFENNLQRNYKIDIETNSTIELDATEDKADVSEFLNALAQFMNGVAPLVENGTLPFEVAKEILSTVVRRFRFGEELEDQLKKMQPPKPPEGPNPEELQQLQEQLQQEAQKLQQERQQFTEQMQQAQMQQMQKEAKFEIMQLKAELQMEAEKASMQQSGQLMMKELQMTQQGHDMKRKMDEHTAKQIPVEEEGEDLDAVAEFLNEGLFQVGNLISAGMIASAHVQRHLEKTGEGTWVSVVDTPLDAEGLLLLETEEESSPDTPVVNLLKAGFKELEKTIAEGIAEAANTPKGIKKNADGTWETFITNETGENLNE